MKVGRSFRSCLIGYLRKVSMNANALLVRAFKTFVQAGLAAWAVTAFSFEQAALVGAAAAGVSALMNLFIQPSEAK